MPQRSFPQSYPTQPAPPPQQFTPTHVPLLHVIKQVPSYAKILKDLCTMKRKHNVKKIAFLTKQVSALIQHNTHPKYKDPSCPTISCIIGDHEIE